MLSRDGQLLVGFRKAARGTTLRLMRSLLLFNARLFSDEVDGIMSIEPAMLSMVNSVPKYVYITQDPVGILVSIGW